MKLTKVLYSWFGYTRSERLGSLVLVLIVSVIIVLRLCHRSDYLPGQADSLIADSLPAIRDTASLPSPFFFDPNTLDVDSLLLLGLSDKQARTLVNYRASGARFRSAEDFRKVYGIDRTLQDSLIPYIIIREGTARAEAGSLKILPQQPAQKPSSSSSSSVGSSYIAGPDIIEPVELNSADSVMLMTLPGIGRVLGPRVVKYRSLLGGFYSPWQLSEVYGIDSLKVADLIIYLSVDTALLQLLDLNRASFGELIRHPYLTEKNTRDILRYRNMAGEFSSLNDLVRNRLLSMSELEKLRPYLVIGDSAIISR